jgi:hypothetical protein
MITIEDAIISENTVNIIVLFEVRSTMLPVRRMIMFSEIRVKGILFLPKVFFVRFKISTTKVYISNNTDVKISINNKLDILML